MLGKWFNFTMIVAMYKYVVSRPVEHSGIDSKATLLLHYKTMEFFKFKSSQRSK